MPMVMTTWPTGSLQQQKDRGDRPRRRPPRQPVRLPLGDAMPQLTRELQPLPSYGYSMHLAASLPAPLRLVCESSPVLARAMIIMMVGGFGRE